MRHPRQPQPPVFAEGHYEDFLVTMGASLPHVPGSAEPLKAARAKLMTRVAASAERNKAFHVSRRDDRPMYVVSPLEVRSILHHGDDFHVEIASLQPGSELGVNGVEVGQEVLVLDGELLASSGGELLARLGQFEYYVWRKR